MIFALLAQYRAPIVVPMPIYYGHGHGPSGPMPPLVAWLLGALLIACSLPFFSIASDNYSDILDKLFGIIVGSVLVIGAIALVIAS